jgi:hypothetical protein
MDVELYADPSCPWSWATYRWLDHVAPRGQLRLVHRPFSLVLRDGTAQLPADRRRVRLEAHRALRIAAAIQDDATRWAFFGAVIEPVAAAVADRRPPAFALPVAARAAGLEAALAARADDDARDAVCAAQMQRLGAELPGGDARRQRIPVVVIDAAGYRAAFLGPLLDPAPTGRDAVLLWDAVETVGRLPGVYEISRPHPGVTR